MPTLSKSDIIEFWPMSLNIDDVRVNPYINRAFEGPLSSLLGPSLALVLKEAVIVPGDKIDLLYTGGKYIEQPPYERLFPGVRALWSAYAYSLMTGNNSIHVTRGGNVKKIDEQSQPLTSAEDSSLSQQAYSEAIRLEGEFYRFMAMMSADYPEYTTEGPAKEGSFNFMNVSRGGYKSWKSFYTSQYGW